MGFKDSIVAPMLKFIVRRMSRARLPRTSGELRVEGLDTPVEVLRDEWGVPHIYASSEHDLFLAQGFVHAQDRFCQMEFSRRLAQGRLAEVFGPDAVPVDRLARTLGFGRLGQADLDRTDPETATMLEAYAAGVNAWMAGEDFRNPVEFRLVRHRVERWSAVNALQFGHVMFWQLSRGWSSELARARLVEAVGAERATEIEVEPSESDPPTLPEGARFFRLGPDGVLEAFTGPFLQNGLGSNGVVVAGSRTATGRPFLSNDMHLPLVLPSFWYQNHLVGGGIEATGVSLPGMPCVIAGHDARIAWGMTLSYGDCEDLFVERFDPARPSWYEHAGAFREAEVRREEILVKGRAEPVVEEVVTTCHGPVISGVFGLDNRLSIASTALRSFNCARGWLLLNRAGDWNGFLDAMRAMEAPPLNVVYADIDGNIGYRVAGVVPVRGRGDGSVPAPGWTGEHDWVGMVPFEEMPGALNPPSGVIVSCNHRIMPSGAGPWMGNAYMSGWRARRIGEMVGDRTGLGSADFKAIQADVTSIPAREILKRIEGLPCKDPDARTALETMRL